MNELDRRLNKLPEKLTSKKLLQNKGLGNDLGFYIFDYPAEKEIYVRKSLSECLSIIDRKSPGIKIITIDIFQMILKYLEDRNFKEKSYILQKQKGNSALIKALKGPLNPTRFSEFMVKDISKDNCDLIIIHRIGSAYPLIRTHELLNNLQPLVDNIPLVLFYPGEYDKSSLRLFGRLKSDGYYRAFKLIT